MSFSAPPGCLTRRQILRRIPAAALGTFWAVRVRAAQGGFAYGTDIDGRKVTSLGAGDTRCVAVVFVATECPISNRYLPLLAEMAEQFSGRGVRLWLVYPNPADDIAAVRAHGAEFPAARTLPQLVAPDPQFVAHAHVRVTPEAAVFQGPSVMGAPVVWHGRIDDRYLTFGAQRPVATRHDLADAIEATLAGRRPNSAESAPVGCAIVPRA
jgi:hypothetical protein